MGMGRVDPGVRLDTDAAERQRTDQWFYKVVGLFTGGNRCIRLNVLVDKSTD